MNARWNLFSVVCYKTGTARKDLNTDPPQAGVHSIHWQPCDTSPYVGRANEKQSFVYVRVCVCDVCMSECAQKQGKESQGEGYGVRSEAGEGDRVRCFRLVESWGGRVNEFAARGTWAPPAALTEPCKQVEWSRNPERRGSLRCDMRGSDRPVCSVTQSRSTHPDSPERDSSLLCHWL